MSVFAKAAAAKKSVKAESGSKKKQTVWGVTDSSKISAAVHELNVLAAQRKAIEAKQDVYKTQVLAFAKDRFYEDYAGNGMFPETPMRVQNHDGEAVTFVVQERNQYGVKDESVDALTQILGEDAVKELLWEETVFGFNRDVLALDGVMDILGKHIESAIGELVESGVLDEEKAGVLLDAEVKRSFRPGVLQRLALIAGRNSSKMRAVCDAMGSSVVQYVKV